MCGYIHPVLGQLNMDIDDQVVFADGASPLFIIVVVTMVWWFRNKPLGSDCLRLRPRSACWYEFFGRLP